MPNCMGASPPWGDRTRPARRRSSAGGGFEEVALPRHQSAGHRVDDHVRLLEHEVAEERLVAVWSRLHLDEDHLAVDSPEPFDLDPDRPPDVGLDQALIGGLDRPWPPLPAPPARPSRRAGGRARTPRCLPTPRSALSASGRGRSSPAPPPQPHPFVAPSSARMGGHSPYGHL